MRYIVVGGFCLMMAVALVSMQYADQLPVQSPLGPYPGTVTAGVLDATFTPAQAAGVARGVTFEITGQELLVVYNTAGTTQYVTFESVADPVTGRYGDINNYALANGDYAVFKYANTRGWRDATGVASVLPSHADIYFMLLKY